MTTAIRRATGWAGLVGLTAFLSFGRLAEAEEYATQTVETGLVAMVPGEELNIRSRISGSSTWRVVVSFHDQADNLIASSIQTAEPGLPTKARIGYAQLPGTEAVRLVHVTAQATPLDCWDDATDALVVTADAVQGNATIRTVDPCRWDNGPITCAAAMPLTCYQP
jgi:hypothetical protein